MKNRDCRFFYEDHDMGKSIPCCSLHEYTDCPCETCNRYFERVPAIPDKSEHDMGKTIPY